jgi:DNA phosphorothioation-dependent restriction protein DptG
MVYRKKKNGWFGLITGMLILMALIAAVRFMEMKEATSSDKFRFKLYPNIEELIQTHKDLITNDTYLNSNRWMEHLENDLMKFWNKESVKDMNKGLFRSFFTDDGKWLPGLDEVDRWPQIFREAIEKDENGE